MSSSSSAAKHFVFIVRSLTPYSSRLKFNLDSSTKNISVVIVNADI